MTNPTDEQLKRVQEKIAEVLGWTDFETDYQGNFYGIPPRLKDDPLPERIKVPNWPGSLDTARGLSIREGHYQRAKFAKALGRITGGTLKIIFATAYQWCLAWLESEHGWRWAECAECRGIGKLCDCCGNQQPAPGDKACEGCQVADWTTCHICNGAGGEFLDSRVK